MKKIFFLTSLFFSLISYSQVKDFEVKGIINSSEDKDLLESATVHAERIKDSSIVSYTITNEKGKFSLVGKTSDSKIKLVVSFIGFTPYTKIIDVKNQNVGTLSLKTANVLDAVVIRSSAPITIKKDTLEFNVSSGGNPNGYGMQAVLLDASNANAGNLLTTTTANTQLSTISNGREFVEHQGRSTTGMFIATWEAPAAGTGDVLVYSIGIAVNGAGTSGDNTSPTVQTVLSESPASSRDDLHIEE